MSRSLRGEFSRLPACGVCFTPAAGEHPTERGEKPPSLQTALTTTAVRKLETFQAPETEFRGFHRGRQRPQGSRERARGASPLKPHGSYFPWVLADTSMFSYLLMLRLHHGTCRFAAGELLFAVKFPSLAPGLSLDVLVGLEESCWSLTICSKQGAPWWLTVSENFGH